MKNRSMIRKPEPRIRLRRSFLTVFLCTSVFLLVAAACIPPVAGAQYIVAPSGGGFTSIQNAVTWASPLDTIIVRSGTYPGTVKINKKITLIGVNTGGGAPIIDPGKTGTAIEIDADGCTVEGFTIQNSVANGVLVASNENMVVNNTITGNAVGIQLSSSSGNSVTGNSVSNSNRAGIVLRNAKNNLVQGNTVTKNTIGITVDESSSGNTITYNAFSNTENVVSRGTNQLWESSSSLSYVYLGRTFTGKLGNYWSDYRGSDQNSDGIGISPYIVGSGINRNAGSISPNDEDSAPLMDPIEYYTQIQPAVTTASPSLAPVATQETVVSDQTNSGTSAPVVGDRADRGLVTLIVMIIGICIVGIGGMLYLRSRSSRDEKTIGGGQHSAGETIPRAIPEHPEHEEPQNIVVEPLESSPRDTAPAQETEVEPAPREIPQAATPKFYFPPELESRYADIRHIGRGGVAHVFAAHRKSDNLLVAVKIPISFDEVTGKCFLNEIAAWQTLRHRNIVEVLEVNILPVPYVEMEYVPGSLESIAKPIPVWKAVHLVHGIADGLAYAHAHGIIHRDIKPHNILVTSDFIPKITDWGMSKVIATTMEKSSVAGFSLSYAAPEQVSPAEFGRTDVRTDIYQLGALFYELVTGSIPFGGESIVEVGNAIVRDEPIPPTEYNPEAEAVEKIILKCLAKKPADRYQSADELLDALSRYLDEDEG